MLLWEDGGTACLSLVSDHGMLLLLIGQGVKIFYISKKRHRKKSGGVPCLCILKSLYICTTKLHANHKHIINCTLPMNHPLVRRYRHRALVLWLSVVSLLLFIGIQAACYVIASHPRWLFILSFFVPNLIALTWGVRLADRRGLERGIILLGVAGVSFLFMGLFGIGCLYFSI